MSHLSDDEIRERINAYPHWYHQIELRPGLVSPGINNTPLVLETLDLPVACKGLRVLDLGTRDGAFAFEFEKRGADVLAVDYVPSDQTGFDIAAAALGSQVPYLHENIYNLSPEKIGKFDIVLCLGLLYHLRDPLLALDIIRSLCTDRLYLETQIIDNALLMPDGTFAPLAAISDQLVDIPLMQFYPGSSLNDDDTNYWAPNVACLTNMLGTAGFAIDRTTVLGSRAIVTGHTMSDVRIDYQREIARGTVGDAPQHSIS